MKLAYVDSSCVVAALLGEPGTIKLTRRIATFDVVRSSHLLEAEVRAAALREGVTLDDAALAGLRWVQPDRRLAPELKRVFELGSLRGAEAWHLACALYVVEAPADVTYLTLERPQQTVANKLGFTV